MGTEQLNVLITSVIGLITSGTAKYWTSDVDNNVWEPGVYGWTEVE